MDFMVCSQCGKEIEGKGVQFRGQVFCNDDCCDAFEEDLSTQDIPSLDDLDDDGDELLTGGLDDLGYREDNSLDEDLDDDEFHIRDADF